MSEEFEDGDYLVRVRAQVMTRDDSTGGWVPMGGGGLSNVSVRKRGLSSSSTDPNDSKNEYLIFGKRISDQSVVLSCTIKKDFEYNKVMPTFHHWKTDDKKFGLTFQTAADARAFDKGVRAAVEELIEGIHGIPPCLADVVDDDVFMAVNLPAERGESRSSTDSSADKPLPVDCENYTYVQLSAMHDYMYPVRPPGESSLKKPSHLSLNPSPKGKERCVHCQETYSSEENVRGSCAYAPDQVQATIDRVACIGLARRVLQSEPCGDVSCGRRCLSLGLLSLLLPCLCLYLPLRACHVCAVCCGVCGGKHQPDS